MFPKIGTSCGFTDVTVNDEVLSRRIARLPEGMESGPQDYRLIFPGLQVGGITVHGLSKLRQFGPVIPYCTNGSRMVQVEIYSGGETHFLAPWKTCSGDSGHIKLDASLARFTFQFRITESTAAGVKFEFDRALPVVTQGVRIYVDGASPAVRATVEVLSAVLPAFIEHLFSSQFLQNVSKAFQLTNQ